MYASYATHGQLMVNFRCLLYTYRLIVFLHLSGSLAEKALAAVVPQAFPFAIRLTSQVMMSNGKKQKNARFN
jgi:hypothetical protein